jgi:hypothetical protein
MAIQFLHDIDLNGNELQNIKLHVTSSAPSAAAGAIFFDSGNNLLKVCLDGTNFVTVATGSDANTQNVFTSSFVDDNNDALLRLTKSGASSGTQDIKFVAGNNITLTPNGAGDELSIAATTTPLTQEQVEDFVGGLITGNDGEGITTTYDDTNGTLKIEAELASSSNAGVAKFSTNNFSVHPTTGNVQIKDNGVANAELVNDSITINGTAISLGGSVTTPNDNTDTLQNIAAATDDDDKFVTFVETATGAQTGQSQSNFKFNPSTGTLKVTNLEVSGTQTISNETVQVVENNTILFEGATADDFETKLTLVDPTADRTIQLPNQSGYVAIFDTASTDAISATPAELNVLDGFTGVTADLTYAKDLRATGVTTTEFDLLDGGSTVGTSAVAAADGFIHNDNGVMKQTQVGKIASLFAGTGLTATSGVINIDAAQTGITSIYNTGLKVGRASDDARISFSTSGAVSIIANSDGQAGIKVQSTKLSPITNNAVDLGNQGGAFKDLYLTGSIKLSGTTVTASGAELNFVDGVTSNIQTQLDAKESSSNKVTKKISGDGSTTAFEVTHGFGTQLVRTTVLHYGNNGNSATYQNVYVDVKNSTTSNTSNNKITVTFGSAPSGTEDYLVLVEKFPAIS